MRRLKKPAAALAARLLRLPPPFSSGSSPRFIPAERSSLPAGRVILQASAPEVDRVLELCALRTSQEMGRGAEFPGEQKLGSGWGQGTGGEGELRAEP